MKKIKQWYSFTGLCVVLLLIYTVSFLLYRGIFEYLDAQRMENAFPTISSILEYEDFLMSDQYSQIPIKNFPNSSFIVFDHDTRSLVYASDEKISQSIFYEDLDFIIDASSNSYYMVSKRSENNGHISYLITLEVYDEEEDMSLISKYCMLDENYNYLEGNLFSQYKSLDARQIRLLQGNLGRKKLIEKYSFSNQKQEGRELVFVSPRITESTYNMVLKESRMHQIYAFPIFIIVVLIQLIFFRYVIKRSFLPFQKVIERYREDTQADFGDTLIPMELRQTVQEFKWTMHCLEQSKQETEKINQEKYTMISGISHDLKTPLTVIQGFSKALLEGRIPEEKKEKYLKTIYDRSIKASDLMDSLFAYTKIEHPSFMPRFEKVDVCEFTKQFLAMKYQEIIDHEFQLEINIPDTMYFSNLDSKLFERALENIIENSLRHNEKGTTIFVQIKHQGGKNIWILADDGQGMDKETSQNIFLPFVTGDQSRSQNKGNGLGMAIVKKIVVLHQGDIQLQTFVSKQCSVKFTISLPAIENSI